MRTLGVLALITHGREEKIKIRDEEINKLGDEEMKSMRDEETKSGV